MIYFSEKIKLSLIPKASYGIMIRLPTVVNLATDWRRFVMLHKIFSFILSVMASVVAYYICKWLDDKLNR